MEKALIILLLFIMLLLQKYKSGGFQRIKIIIFIFAKDITKSQDIPNKERISIAMSDLKAKVNGFIEGFPQ